MSRPPLTATQADRILSGGDDDTRRRLHSLLEQVKQASSLANWKACKLPDGSYGALAQLIVPCSAQRFQERYGIPAGRLVELCNSKVGCEYTCRLASDDESIVIDCSKEALLMLDYHPRTPRTK